MAHPELIKRPFGSVFWENGAGLTWLLQKEEQNEYSPLASIGVFQKKYNDTGRLRDFSLSFMFNADGSIAVDSASLRDSAVLLETKGPEWPLYELLSQPMSLKQLSEASGKTEDACRKLMVRHPRLFERLNPGVGGSGQRGVVAAHGGGASRTG